MELHDAIAQISEIRAQIARTGTFRGYRSLTLGISGLTAFAAAGLQALLVPEPQRQISAYLALWLSAATFSILVTGLEMTWRCRREATGLSSRLTWMAVEQFLPCVLAGGLLTFVVAQFLPSSFAMLPGLWSMLFSLGIFASARLLPKPVFFVAGYYLAAGALCLALARGDAALSPWAMAVPFGVGQLMAAGVLYWTLERGNARPR
jgi:hypothetical protein